MIYLDYASNTPADPAVLAAYLEAERCYFGNPNAHHPLGRAADEALQGYINRIASALGARPEEIVHTSGASEANNLALKGIAYAYRHSGRHILTTCLEHPSVSGTLTALQEQGWEVELVPLMPSGAIDLGALAEMLRGDTVLLAISWVDSELGAVQPLAEIVRALAEYPNCHLHVDATQGIGKLPVCMEGIHTMTIAPHKFYGLNGAGVLVRRHDVILTPLIHGGAGVSAYRSGTPTVALAGATALALELAEENRQDRYSQVSALRKRLELALRAYPLVRINSTDEGTPYILNLSVKGVKGGVFQQALAGRGVCVSVKSACSVPGTPSRPVLAISKDRKNALASWRISLSHLTTEAEIDAFLEIFASCYEELTV